MTGENPKENLIGQFFHTRLFDGGAIRRQGRVIGNPEPGWYLLELFDWVLGEPSERRLANIEEMRYWLFYGDADWMRSAWKHHSRKQKKDCEAE